MIYTGACPNQHLLPLFEHMLPAYRATRLSAGANYIWGWEMNRLAREIVTEAGGEIVGERCLPIGDTDVDRIVAEVAARRPDFILSNMLGPSNHAFLRAMRELGRRDPAFRPERCPVVSCDLTECELPEIGFGVADGQLAAASYFDSLDTLGEPRSQSAGRGAIRLRAPRVELFRNQLRDGSPLRRGRDPLRNRRPYRKSEPPSPAWRRRVLSDRCELIRPPTTPICRSCSAGYRAPISSSFSPGQPRWRTRTSSARGLPLQPRRRAAAAQGRLMKGTPQLPWPESRHPASPGRHDRSSRSSVRAAWTPRRSALAAVARCRGRRHRSCRRRRRMGRASAVDGLLKSRRRSSRCLPLRRPGASLGRSIKALTRSSPNPSPLPLSIRRW